VSKLVGLGEWIRRLSRFFAIDLRSLGLFRIALGTYVFWDLLDRGRFLEAHYTDFGVYPRDAVVEKWSEGTYWERLWAFTSFHMASGELAWQAFLFVVTAVFALALIVGYRSRGSAFLCWVMALSLQNRNPHVLHGGDQMIRQLLFWSMFLPLGARFSVDGLCAVQKAYKVPVSTVVCSFGSVGLLLQTAFLYWFTVLLKSAPQWHAEGTALYYALSLEHYQTVQGRFLLNFLPVFAWKLGTWATMALEALGPCLMFFPKATERIRVLVVLLFFCFHLVLIGGLMDVGPIVSTSAILWICFLPGLFWEALSRWWGSLPSHPLKNVLEQARARLIHWRNQRIVRRIQFHEGVPNLRPTLIAQAFAAFAIVYVLIWNLRGVDGRRFVLPANLEWVANVVRLDQNWGMFAPYPMIEDGWFIMPATLKDGTKIDLLRKGAPVTWAKPKSVASTYVNERERKYIMNLWPVALSDQRPYFVRYMRNRWYRDHPDQPLKDISLYYMLHITPPPGKPQPEPRKMLLFNETETTPGVVER